MKYLEYYRICRYIALKNDKKTVYLGKKFMRKSIVPLFPFRLYDLFPVRGSRF